MEKDKDNSETLDIRCPNCRQRFSVASKLINRVVECGGCDTQFSITEETVIHSKKVYPGEKNEPELAQFRRIPLSSAPMPIGMQTINYAEFNHPEQLGPASPQRIIAGIFGVCIMLFGALLLFLSTNPTSPLGGMPFEKKLIISGFTSLLGFVLLVYANPRARIKASFFGLLLTAGVFAIPIYINEQPHKPNDKLDTSKEIAPSSTENQVTDPIQALRERFVTQPLENEQKRLTSSNSDKNAYGIFLTQMLGRNKLTARDYLIRETLANPSSHPFPRNDNNHLMVISDVRMDFDQVTEIASKLGKITETHPEINIIVVQVDNEQFIAGSAEKLNDRNHPAFYQLNMSELQSIDLGRIELAVERLADSDAAILRGDIAKILIQLLEKPGVTFHDAIARALLKWAEDPSQVANSALKILKTYDSRKASPPEHLVKLVAENKKPEAIPTMISIWEANPVLWDKELVKFGNPIEFPILKRLNTDELSMRRAIIKILGDVGTEQSLPELRKALTDKDPEVRVLAERAIQQIEQR